MAEDNPTDRLPGENKWDHVERELAKGDDGDIDPKYREAFDARMADTRRPAFPGRLPPLTPADKVHAAARADVPPAPHPTANTPRGPMSIRPDYPNRMRQTFDFPSAMDALLAGERIGRVGWPDGEFATIARVPTFHMQRVENSRSIQATSHIDTVQLGQQILRRRVAYNAWAPWTPSNEEIFEKDWLIYG